MAMIMHDAQMSGSETRTKGKRNAFATFLRTTTAIATAATVISYYGCSTRTGNSDSAANNTDTSLEMRQSDAIGNAPLRHPALHFYKTLSPFYGLHNNDKIYNQHAYVTFPGSHKWLEIRTRVVPDTDKNVLMGTLLLNGMTDTGWWCQIGLAQFPKYKGPLSRYFILVNIYNPGTKLVSRPVYSLSQSIKPNDNIRLCMRIIDDRVLLSGNDLSTNREVDLLINIKAKKFIESENERDPEGNRLMSPTGVMFEGYTKNRNGYAGSIPIVATVVEPKLAGYRYLAMGEDIIPITIRRQNHNMPLIPIFDRQNAISFRVSEISKHKRFFSYRFDGSETEIKYHIDPIRISFDGVGERNGSFNETGNKATHLYLDK